MRGADRAAVSSCAQPVGATAESAAREVAADSRIPYAVYETDNGMNHLDPLFAGPEHNTLTASLPSFLAGPQST